jgi:hypothetical protein
VLPSGQCRVANLGKSPLKTASAFAGVCQRNTLMLLGFASPAGVAKQINNLEKKVYAAGIKGNK